MYLFNCAIRNTGRINQTKMKLVMFRVNEVERMREWKWSSRAGGNTSLSVPFHMALTLPTMLIFHISSQCING